MRAVRIEEFGPAEILRLTEVKLRALADGEVVVRHHAIGVNYKDIQHRSGATPIRLPSGLGFEASGIVEEVGPKVNGVQVGDRVGYAISELGAYADRRILQAYQLIKLPDDISFEIAAASLTKGLTAEYLINQICTFNRREWILIYAAAGGVGSILTQWALKKELNVIGVVGSEKKTRIFS
jgi:NADPH:quinone reductase